MSRCSLTSPPSHKRVLTIIASAIHTMPPCFLTRSSSACTCPQSRGCLTRWLLTALPPWTACGQHRQRHPPDAPLFLDAQLIGLHLSQVAWLFDQMLVHGLPLSTGACPPRGDRPLVKPKGRHNRLQGTPMGEQGHHDGHGLC